MRCSRTPRAADSPLPVPPGSASRSRRGRGDAALELVLSDLQADDQRPHQQQWDSKQQQESADAHVDWFQGHRESPVLLAEPVLPRVTRTGTVPLVAPLP